MTSPLHGEDPGFKSPWAHTILVIEIDPSTRKFMRIELDTVGELVDSLVKYLQVLGNS